MVQRVEEKYKKKAVTDVKSGDTVKVHQKIREAGKERVQIFEGLVIKTTRKNSLSRNFTVRHIASGIGVEKTFFNHSPNILKVEVTKRAKVRRNYLSYMRHLTGKNARLLGVDFEKDKVNVIHEEEVEAEEEKIKEEAEKAHEEKEAKKAEEAAKLEAKAEAALAKHDQTKAETEQPTSNTDSKKTDQP